ncbi:RNA polymerase sigma-54 factor [candidate division WOR-3 bacterium]|uniref:RNA polymerase sigma-54 factor n=1 Tax=candidate division WOR-3 bacterium TaxID=2052148 RepID=A0A660SGK1_UNCW3|nr:MAG: RNA polymerase sigma-54 factor [candidate division WOR-3 bacterium]
MRSELKGELQLILTPRLIHYLTVLQLPILDLVQTLKQEIQTNPALEEIEAESEEETGEEIEDIFGELDLYLPESREEETNIFENVPAPPENIFSHLDRQIRARFRGEELRIALALLYDLDHEGMLHTPEEELAAKLGVETRLVAEIRARLKQLDPVGCFSYNSIEALKAQLEADGYGPDSPEYQALNSLSGEEVDPEILKKLSKYHPKPGLKYSKDLPQYVIPDIIVTWHGDDLIGFHNDDPIPRVRLRRELIDIIKAPNAFTKEEVRFAREKLRAAKNLLVAIAERNQTLNRLAQLLVETQKEYFLKGEDFIKPLTMRYVAENLNLSVSTISRAVSGKYLESPRGIMPLKKFFISGQVDEKRSRILKRIEELLRQEDRKRPLSDAEIARILSEEGFVISRRTVTKYRQELGYGRKGKR